MLSNISIYTPRKFQHGIILLSKPQHIYQYDATDYWPMAREYLVWNAAVAALQFSMADIDAHILGSTIDKLFNAFFYST